ncbi:MAG: DsbA family protein [Candidatus Nitrosotenuis sp.]
MLGVFFAMSALMETGFKIEDIKQSEAEKEQEMTATNAPQQVSMSIFSDNASPILGKPDAPITIVEFGDYQCFYCNKFFHDTEDQIYENYIKTGKAKMIFKDFVIIGPDSVTAAHGAHCADEQGKFWDYHDTLYNNWSGENNGWASLENQHKFAQQMGLDTVAFAECMESGRYNEKIQASTNDAQTLGLSGTPAFFIIGPNNKIVRVPGAQPYDVFVNILESEQLKGN